MIYADIMLRVKFQVIPQPIYLGPWAPPFDAHTREELKVLAEELLQEFASHLIGSETMTEIMKDARIFLASRGWSEVPFQVVRVSVDIPRLT